MDNQDGKIFVDEIDFAHIRKQMGIAFNLSEIKSLCFDMHIDNEQLSGDTLDDKIRELIKYCHRHGKISEFLLILEAIRPKMRWYSSEESIDENPTIYSTTLLEIHALIKAFNRSRLLPPSRQRIEYGDTIAYEMRELSPKLFNQLDIDRWLISPNPGKKLVALTYLDWIQDIEYVDTLLAMLPAESPFLQFYILIALQSMIDQVSHNMRTRVAETLHAYNPPEHSHRVKWRSQILALLEN
jgi:hypothetical protein